ncbi:MAG: hypothetical protein ACRDTO_10120 [Mycobacterium sp.]
MSEQPFQDPITAARSVVDQVAATVTAAAGQIDAGTYSLDDRIKAMHRLFDLSVQGWAGLAQAAVSGPACGVQWNAAPAPSDPIPVTTDPTYPRNIEIAVSFVQVGDSSVVIPDHQIEFIPELLEVGATQFQIAVKEPNLSGRCYTGAVRLTTITPTGIPSVAEILPIPDVEL